MIKAWLFIKRYWGVVLGVLVGIKFFFRDKPVTPYDRGTWRKREVLKEREDVAKKDAVDNLVDRLDDDWDERKRRILSRYRGIVKK